MKMNLFAGLAVMLALMAGSLCVGPGNVTLSGLWTNAEMRDIALISRVPRTLALMLAGCAMSVSGLILQMLTQNRFVEPTLAGTTQSASLGLLLVTLISPSAPVITKMAVSTLFALAGTLLFMLLIQRMRIRSALLVPLSGMMLGAVFSAITTFLAMQFDLLQSLGGWASGDFSGVMQGRYELLWSVGGLTLLAMLIADRFTLAGMGRDISVNSGLNYPRVMLTGMTIIALVCGVVVVVIGVLPFVGLIVPNIVSMAMGDNLRRSLPWVTMCGGGLVVLCDIAGRLIGYPFEVPASAMLGVVGAVIFLTLLLRKKRHAR
ncbi:ABC transporter permease [Erwinia tasmaniensis]|uniref:ABC transporter permease n=1 Tax=Erwinia tasmaniensis TaxID=338565 RepID=UPI003A4DE62B